MKRSRASFAVLVITALSASASLNPADEKDKNKAKAKAPARSYSDEDLKKYKDPHKEDGVEGQPGSAGESGNADESQRHSPEGERQGELIIRRRVGQDPANADVSPPPADEPPSPEEASWKARAAEARRPLQEAQNRIQGIEAEMAEQRDKLNPMSTKYVLGGNSTAGPGAIYEVEERLRVLEGHLVDARAVAAEAERSWQQFLDEARASGASPAWLNP